MSKQARLLRQELPALLAQLERIPDPRDPRKRRHKLTVLLLYGLLMFVFQFSSRRETNREMTCPQFLANLHLLFRRSRPCRTPTPSIGCCATSTWPTSNRGTSTWCAA
ncbi:transposase family protein [Accumulibacter sp.]|uniref:transposase family protein n=1 Tax=Accumulibacter sp. TaxID=2053492 RepID=UPI001A3952A5|nr:transposase family protein [Accumulibacter sp.]MBL8375855.1 transposase family protein [Accumulibacter sp.]